LQLFHPEILIKLLLEGLDIQFNFKRNKFDNLDSSIQPALVEPEKETNVDGQFYALGLKEEKSLSQEANMPEETLPFTTKKPREEGLIPKHRKMFNELPDSIIKESLGKIIIDVATNLSADSYLVILNNIKNFLAENKSRMTKGEKDTLAMYKKNINTKAQRALDNENRSQAERTAVL
jgi:hypothetical protein